MEVIWPASAEKGRRRRALRDVQVVLLVATDVEAAPLVAALDGLRTIEVTGGWWHRGRVEGVDVLTVVSGYDKANTAHALTSLFETGRPPLVVQTGIAGAYPGTRLSTLDLVLADEEAYGDTGSSTPGGWVSTEGFGLPLAAVDGRQFFNCFPIDSGLVTVARDSLEGAEWPDPTPRLAVGRCLTLSQVTGTAEAARTLADRWGALAESMEGAAAAQVCALHRVPFLEIKAISNAVGNRRRDSWDVPGAAARAARAALVLCADAERLLTAAAAGAPGGE